MLDHFHGEHDVEQFAGVRQCFRGRVAVIDGESRPRGMASRHRDVAGRRIGANDRGAKPRQRLGKDAAAAADIEDAQAFEVVELLRIAAEMLGGAVADISEADRVELVQGRHRPMRVPPLAGHREKRATSSRSTVPADGCDSVVRFLVFGFLFYVAARLFAMTFGALATLTATLAQIALAASSTSEELPPIQARQKRAAECTRSEATMARNAPMQALLQKSGRKTLAVRFWYGLAGLVLALCSLVRQHAQDTMKIGIIDPYSGQFADTATQMDNAIKLYIKQHGDTVAGRKIEFIRKDVGGVAPDVAKRLAQELVVRDHVDILAGFVLTPNALAAGAVSAEAKKFMVVMNAATSIITTKSPYIARTSSTTPQLNQTFGTWAAKHGIKRIFTMVSDYGPGIDAETAFHTGFKEAGGEIIGSVRFPVANPDFSAFVQRAKDLNPDAIYIWIPGGAQPAAVGKAWPSAASIPAR